MVREREPLTIHLDPSSELARVLEAGDERSVILDSNGIRYTVAPEDIFAHYDPERVQTALRQSRGALRNVDAAQLLADLRAQRGQDSNGRSD